jgi:hypothetical protein
MQQNKIKQNKLLIITNKSMDFCEQMFTKASQNSDISASCSENIVTVAFYVNVKSCRYFINRLALAVPET